jgi:site-specific recombinase XerD
VKTEHDLYAYRRHLKACQFFGPGGREARADRCNCPYHVDGIHNGRRIKRRSLRTRSRQTADRRVAELIRDLDARAEQAVGMPPRPSLSEAVNRFLQTYGEIGQGGKYRGDAQYATYRKYRASLRLLEEFCHRKRIAELADVTFDHIEDFRRSREIALITWKVELQTLRTFLAYCVRRKWIAGNVAKEIKPPRNLKPNEVVPYTLQEEAQILDACTRIGGGAYSRSGARYEQLRARAMVLLLRHTALRISDVSTFRKDAVSWDQAASTWRIFLRTQKTGEPVFLPIPNSLKLILDALPLPRNAPQDCPHYFWNGVTSRRAVVGIAERTLAAVFKKSGVKDAHAHRYRHTLATRLLERGATFEQVADILGNSPAVVRKHYGKWAKGRQDNIDRLMLAHFQTIPATTPVTLESHEKMGAVN